MSSSSFLNLHSRTPLLSLAFRYADEKKVEWCTAQTENEPDWWRNVVCLVFTLVERVNFLWFPALLASPFGVSGIVRLFKRCFSIMAPLTVAGFGAWEAWGWYTQPTPTPVRNFVRFACLAHPLYNSSKLLVKNSHLTTHDTAFSTQIDPEVERLLREVLRCNYLEMIEYGRSLRDIHGVESIDDLAVLQDNDFRECGMRTGEDASEPSSILIAVFFPHPLILLLVPLVSDGAKTSAGIGPSDGNN